MPDTTVRRWIDLVGILLVVGLMTADESGAQGTDRVIEGPERAAVGMKQGR